MKQWFAIDDLVAAGDPTMPSTVRGWNKIVNAQGWRSVQDKARKVGKAWEYHISLLPPATRERLVFAMAAQPAGPVPVGIAALWSRYAALPQEHKDDCAEKLRAVDAVGHLKVTGYSQREAVAVVAAQYQVSCSTVQNWLRAVRGHKRADWLAALAPKYRPTAQFAECHPDAWEAFKSDYLRPESPGVSACYRRMVTAAAREGWAPIPSEMALRRRLKAEVPEAVMTLKRGTRDQAKALFPAQRRSRKALRAMQVVNIDGHTFDVRVTAPGSMDKIIRPVLVAIQDVYSGKFVGWRLDESENRVPVRLAIGDMVEQFGIPDEMVLDNGRSFASKWITGGTPTRFRFKVRDDEPDGLLTQLGVKCHWATPYAGQSKPIERAFRDLCEDIAKHPFCAGAYTGNSPVNKPDNYGARAIGWDAFRTFVDAMIAEHNGRAGRTSETAKGRSFDEAFSASVADPATVIGWPTAEQRSLWLLMAEEVTARRGSGEIHLLGNRYWSPGLVEHAGRKVHVRFDPDDLARPAKIYDRKGKLLCEAEAIGDVDFLDADAAHRHARNRREYLKLQKQLADMHVTMSPEALGQLYAPAPVPERAPQRPAVTRLATRGNAALKHEPDTDADAWTEDHEAAFANVVKLSGGRLLKDT